MKILANFEVESDVSVIDDDAELVLKRKDGGFLAAIKNVVRQDYSDPFVLRVQIMYDADDLDHAQRIHLDKVADFLDVFALAAGARLKFSRMLQLIDCSSPNPQRDCHIWAARIRHENPRPALDGDVANTVADFLNSPLHPEVMRSIHLYRQGCAALIPADQFRNFFLAIETLAEHVKPSEEVNDICQKCKSPLYCEKCKTHPTHKPFAGKVVRQLIRQVEPKIDEKVINAIIAARHGLAHGTAFSDLQLENDNQQFTIVDVLGFAVLKLLIDQYRPYLKQVKLGIPSTYIQRTITAYSHVGGFVQCEADGRFNPDVSFAGMKFELLPEGPPQSALPKVIVLSEDQKTKLPYLVHTPGPKQDLFQRVWNSTKEYQGKYFAKIFAADVKLISAALKRGDKDEWLEFFRPFFNDGDLAKNKSGAR